MTKVVFKAPAKLVLSEILKQQRLFRKPETPSGALDPLLNLFLAILRKTQKSEQNASLLYDENWYGPVVERRSVFIKYIKLKEGMGKGVDTEPLEKYAL